MAGASAALGLLLAAVVASPAHVVAAAPAVYFTPHNGLLNFPEEYVGHTTPPSSMQLANTGDASLSISSVELGGSFPSDFRITADTCSGQTLAPNTACSVSAVFTPDGNVPRSAQLVFHDDAPDSPQSFQLQGGGVLVGYRMVAADGGLFTYADQYVNSLAGQHLAAPIVGMAVGAAFPGWGIAAFWMVGANGAVYPFGTDNDGGMAGKPLNHPVVGMAATPSGHGYWLVASDGGVFSFGDAGFYGSRGGQPLNKPIVGMAVTPSGHGYWLVASDGGIFAFGDAAFLGSMGATRLNRPVVGMAATPSGHGYWLVATDGGVFTFGDAPFLGSMGATPLNQPVVAMAAMPDAQGYWMVASDGGVFTFGDAIFLGSMGGTRLNKPVVGMSTGTVAYRWP